MAGLIRQLLDARRTHHPFPRLPTDGWCAAPGIARLSLVWPWYVVENPERLVDSHGREVGIRPALELHAPRSDYDVVLIAWSEPGGGVIAGGGWAAGAARMHGGTLDGNCPIVLNGAAGHLARIRTGRDIVRRIIVSRHESVVQLQLNVPAQYDDAYWLHVDTMLATWAWDD